MGHRKREPTQKTRPKGKDAKGKPAKPIDIPVPKRGDFGQLLGRATKGTRQERGE